MIESVIITSELNLLYPPPEITHEHWILLLLLLLIMILMMSLEEPIALVCFTVRDRK